MSASEENIEYIYDVRFWMLQPAEVKKYCSTNLINPRYLYELYIHKNRGCDFAQYFSSKKDKPVAMPALTLISNPNYSQGCYFFVCKMHNSESFAIWGIEDGIILNISSDIALTYPTREKAAEAVDIIANIKGISDFEIEHLDGKSLIKHANLENYNAKPVHAGKLETIVKYTLVLVLLVASSFIGWSIF